MNTLLQRFEKVKKVHVVGRRWFQKTYGNTYHSVEIYVNNSFVHKIEFTYGYGEQYEWNAFAWLTSNGYAKPCDKGNSPWRYFSENGIEYDKTVYDVKRKRDL